MKKEDINENEDSEDGMEDLEMGEEAADFVAGEEDYDDDGFHIKNVKSMIWNSLRNTKRSILIETRYYQVKRNKPLRRDASEVLFKLCQHAKVSVIDVIDVLELGADVNYQGKKGFAALHWVAKRGHSHVLWALLQPQVGANINIVDNRNATPLMYACDSMSSEQAVIVREILNTDKAKVNIRDSGGNTALLNAIYKNNVWVVRELLLYPRKISVLLKQEKEDPSPYELGQFIFTNGLLSEVEDIHPFVLEPALGSIHEGTWRRRWNTLLYRLFSPKGHYKYAWLVKIQEYNSYDAEIVFRMIQRRSYEEGRKPAMVLPHKKGPPPGTFKSEEELLNDRHKKFVEKYYKPVVMKRKKKSEYESMKEHKERSLKKKEEQAMAIARAKHSKEIEAWNLKRKMNASKVNKEFDHRLRGDKSNDFIGAFEMTKPTKQGSDEDDVVPAVGYGPEGAEKAPPLKNQEWQIATSSATKKNKLIEKLQKNDEHFYEDLYDYSDEESAEENSSIKKKKPANDPNEDTDSEWDIDELDGDEKYPHNGKYGSIRAGTNTVNNSPEPKGKMSNRNKKVEMDPALTMKPIVPGGYSLTASLAKAKAMRKLTQSETNRLASNMIDTEKLHSPTQLVRTDIGYVNTKSKYAKYNLNEDYHLSEQEINQDRYIGDDFNPDEDE